MTARLRDRREAGRRLAAHLGHFAGRSDVIVLGLPRGGIPVAFEVARALGAPLDAIVVRKLGVPGHEELAMGAVASGGLRIVDSAVLRQLDIGRDALDAITDVEVHELERRERIYRGGAPAPEVRDRTVILVDDGLATGSTVFAAVEALRKQEPAEIIVAAPIGSPATCEVLERVADDCVCLDMPEPMLGVGRWYEDFAPTSDAEVHALLAEASRAGEARAPTQLGERRAAAEPSR